MLKELWPLLALMKAKDLKRCFCKMTALTLKFLFDFLTDVAAHILLVVFKWLAKVVIMPLLWFQLVFSLALKKIASNIIIESEEWSSQSMFQFN